MSYVWAALALALLCAAWVGVQQLCADVWVGVQQLCADDADGGTEPGCGSCSEKRGCAAGEAPPACPKEERVPH